MTQPYQHLGVFGDWVTAAQQQQVLWPVARPGLETQQKVRDVLGFCNGPEQPIDVRIEHTWTSDGLVGEEISWSVGYGPRTYGWVLKPAGATTRLPGIVALHDHGGFKFFGKEKIADGPDQVLPVIKNFRTSAYGGRAFANALAKEGYVVLAHDVFLWGTRRFPLDTMPEWMHVATQGTESTWYAGGAGKNDAPHEIAEYNAAATFQELMIEKYCALLGTTLAGVVSHEDRIAVRYLQSRADVIAERVGCIGLSGGGCRSALLQATCNDISAAVIVGMMTTYEQLLYRHVDSHTWMFFPTGWARYGDWSDLAACRAPSPLFIQYDLDDELFPVEGMRAAHERITGHYNEMGHPERYAGQFYPGPHKFDLEMQAAAFEWLKGTL